MRSRFKQSTYNIVLKLNYLKIEIFFRLWNELTIKLNKFVRNAAMQDEDALLQLYQNFLQTFEMK